MTFQIRCCDGIVYQSGITPQDTPLWNEDFTLSQAQQNLRSALNQPQLPIFLGGEHLQATSDWPQERPCIVIEPCKGYADLVLQRNPTSSNVTIIKGEIGFISPVLAAWCRPIFFSQEVGTFILNLLTHPLANLANAKVYGIDRGNPGNAILNVLQDAINLTIFAASQLLMHSARCSRYCSTPKSNTALILQTPGTPYNQDSVSWLVPLLDQLDVQSYQLPSLNVQDPKSISLAIEAILDQLESLRPARVLMLNRSAFPEIADVVISETVFRLCGLPVESVFQDWFTHQSSLYLGGWSHEWLSDHGPSDTKRYTFYETQSRYHLPKTGQTFAFDLNYHDARQAAQSPVATECEFTCDIAILHATRIQAVSPEVNELFEIVTDSKDFSEIISGEKEFNFLTTLREHFKTITTLPQNSYGWKTLINALDFHFYNQARIRNVIATVNAFPELRIKVYGAGWKHFIPESLCGGWLNSASDMVDVWRHSKATIDFAQTYSRLTPHLPAIRCLQAGGFPLIIKPFLTDARHLDHDEKGPKIFCSIANLKSELNSINSIENRNQLIDQAQRSWLPQLQLSSSKPRRLIPAMPPLPSEHTNNILPIGEAYLYLLAGFPMAALNLFHRSLTQTPQQHTIAWKRALLLAEQLGQKQILTELHQCATRPI